MKRNCRPRPYKHVVIIVACFVALHGCGLIKPEPPQPPQRSQLPQPPQRFQLSQPKGAASYGEPRVVYGEMKIQVAPEHKILKITTTTPITIIEWSDISALNGWNLVIRQPNRSARMLIRPIVEEICAGKICIPTPVSLSLNNFQKTGEVFVASLAGCSAILDGRRYSDSSSFIASDCRIVNGVIAPEVCASAACGLWRIPQPISNAEFLQSLLTE